MKCKARLMLPYSAEHFTRRSYQNGAKIKRVRLAS